MKTIKFINLQAEFFDCNNNIKELMKITLFAIAVFAATTEVSLIPF